MLFGIFLTIRLSNLPSTWELKAQSQPLTKFNIIDLFSLRKCRNHWPLSHNYLCWTCIDPDHLPHTQGTQCSSQSLKACIQLTSLAHQILTVPLNHVYWTNLISSCSLDVEADWERMNQQYCALPDVQPKQRPTSQEHITSQCHCTSFSSTVRQKCRNRLLTVPRSMPW